MGKLGTILFCLFLALPNLAAQKIINGSAVAKSDPLYWSTVRIIEKNQEDIWVPNCSGIILGKNIILTAAHCLSRSDKSVYRVAYELQPFSFEQQYFENTRIDPTIDYQTRAILDLDIHPEYTKQNPGNDLAVLKIEGEHPERFKALPMMNHEMMNRLVGGKNYHFFVAGYGMFAARPVVESDVLRKAKLSGVVNDDYIVMDQSKGLGGCFGDSGGPAIMVFGNMTYLVGLTQGSAGSSKDCDQMGIWVNLPRQMSFINSSLKKLNRR